MTKNRTEAKLIVGLELVKLNEKYKDNYHVRAQLGELCSINEDDLTFKDYLNSDLYSSLLKTI